MITSSEGRLAVVAAASLLIASVLWVAWSRVFTGLADPNVLAFAFWLVGLVSLIAALAGVLVGIGEVIRAHRVQDRRTRDWLWLLLTFGILGVWIAVLASGLWHV